MGAESSLVVCEGPVPDDLDEEAGLGVVSDVGAAAGAVVPACTRIRLTVSVAAAAPDPVPVEQTARSPEREQPIPMVNSPNGAA